ncbi:uncharacterized protein P884DRAFT_257554 [Thermothelomyces heterothallicus CBS 202.75]|uniref:uncharacterized protein n=1 Tax=Thermothelomyces heterothallicus CBS 202.75 TaxID=1149848 RepID=UPI003743D9E9
MINNVRGTCRRREAGASLTSKDNVRRGPAPPSGTPALPSPEETGPRAAAVLRPDRRPISDTPGSGGWPTPAHCAALLLVR